MLLDTVQLSLANLLHGFGWRLPDGVSPEVVSVDEKYGLSLSLANLLHGFGWRLPDGVSPEVVSVDEKYGLSVIWLFSLEAVAEPKLPAHLYARP
ncbi:hypothetical protein PR202_gb19947 [Eleusine coracana subsp. coracana]|uniref:Uncharacterized protein n=1 Tax=Eleusine coracana subsp. coracana TaxID=191504 RepID=A0AAV5F997_ELECO|nr:hypothetical protein PR202_gb19947 [Eleusine coracana subsp. coracana]